MPESYCHFSRRIRNDLDEDLTFNLALTHLVEIIGEAANRVPEEFQEDHPENSVAQIIGMRNRLIHGYDEVDLNFLWSVVENDLPGLIAQLEIAFKRWLWRKKVVCLTAPANLTIIAAYPPIVVSTNPRAKPPQGASGV